MKHFGLVALAVILVVACSDDNPIAPPARDVGHDTLGDPRTDDASTDSNDSDTGHEDVSTDQSNDTNVADTSHDVNSDVDDAGAECDDLQSRYTSVANPVPPPYSGTLFVSPDILTSADPTSFDGLSYEGQGDRTMFDRRTASFETFHAHLFNARFADRVVEIQVNPEFSAAQAEVEARKYAESIGRIPAFFFRDLDTVWIHDGDEPAGGGNRNLLIHTVQGEEYISQGIIEELFVHEGAHTSLDSYHANHPDWVAAQQADGGFISTYARDNPTREDVAESIGMWLAVRFFRERVPDIADQIEQAIPNRLLYLDCAYRSADILR